MPRPNIRVGVYIPHGSQLLDLACVDVLHIASHAYLTIVGSTLPKSLVDLAPDVTILYVSSTPASSTQPLTADARITVTHHFSDPEVAPGKLDVVFVPGPDPADVFTKEETAWLAAQAATEGVDVLSVCTGIFLCGQAGLLKGRTVSGPRGLQGDIKKKFEGVKLAGDEYRWVRDGNFWSSGGITNGNDLMAAYLRTSGKFPGPVAEFACMMADVGDRGQVYSQGQARFTLGVAWQLLKSVFMSFGKAKEA